MMGFIKYHQIVLQGNRNLLLSSVMHEASSLHVFSSVLGSIQILKFFYFDGSEMVSHCLICISFVTDEFEDFLPIQFPFCMILILVLVRFLFLLICKGFLFLRF